MAQYGDVLALDLGGVVGWALGDPLADDTPARWGRWPLPSIGGRAARLVAFDNELWAQLGVMQPALVVMESTLPIAAMKGEDAAKQQICLAGIVEAHCHRASIPCEGIGRDNVLMELLGACRFAQKGEGKRRILAWCRQRGLKVADDNTADAIAVWEHRRRLIKRGYGR